MQTYPLTHHPDFPPAVVSNLSTKVLSAERGWLQLRWRIDGANSLVLPPFAGRDRADGLWQRTCFELFLKAEGSDSYVEVNLSPSEQWAVYDFSSYREGMTARPMSRGPTCTIRLARTTVIFDAALPLAGLPPLPWRAGLAAVVEEQGGTKSYWALAHPAARPDFHHPDCFAITVPAAEGP